MSKDAPAQYSLALSTDKGIAQTNTAARESQLRRNGEQTAGARRSEVSFPLMTVDEVLSPRRPADPGTDEVLDATDAPRFESRAPAVAMRMPLVLFAAAGVLFASGAPSVTIGVHLLNEPLSFETWAFSYPMTAVGLIGVVLFWSSLGRRPVRSWPWAIWPLALLVGWSLLSVVWSVSPELTGPRALTSVGIAAFSVWFGYELKFDEQLVALALFSAAATAASYTLIIFRPNIGRGNGEGWQGAFASANSLGPAAAVGIVVAVGVAVRYRRPVIVAVSTVALLADLVLLKGALSVTAVAGPVVGALAAVGAVIVRNLQARDVPGRVVGSSVVLLGGGAFVAVATNIGTVASFFGQDPMLSSRTRIWTEVRQFISERPVTGYGYWAFWENLEYSWESYNRIGGHYGSAHNSFFEVGLGLGLVGAALFGLIVTGGVAAVALRAWRFGDAASIGWVVLLAVVLVEHLMESFVLWHSYVWVLLVAAACTPTSRHEELARWSHGVRSRTASGMDE